MSVQLTIPREYGYVLAVASATMFFSMWQGLRVGPFRKAAKIPYPQPYASPEELASEKDPARKQAMYLFNCAQRAHGNFLENYPAVLPAILIAGLGYPRGAAVSGALWTVLRWVYARGYTRKDMTNGKGRLMGSGFWIVQTVLFGMVGKMAWDILMV
ncbi:membrane-associated proteins in eicosanoid and glutathione metabolism [Tothia fuscella]|uniref:Membrane-associated proteins in eicosanoid and glutathione metabolism n=1 Tax=Tothia fuscella TaxID=1048955 RepID=A0A9P4NUZ3_9PEZI|nr:membrane-associated proteins in eicosanoid and glutathione metabolism [Tothia fuscella]